MTASLSFRPSRRDVLGGLAALPLLGLPAHAAAAPDNRFVLVILRGGMDGLAAVPAYGDPHYRALRKQLALPNPGEENGIHAIDDLFGLHPAFKVFAELHRNSQLIAFHALASPYRERSHFHAQDVLENGFNAAQAARHGWLNRSIAAVAASSSTNPGELAMAFGNTVPLVLRGDAPVTSWAPSSLPASNPGTLERLAELYQSDATLGPVFAKAMAARGIAGASMGGMKAGRRANAPRYFAELMRAAGKFIRAPEGPRIAVLEFDGWDTHAQQGAAKGRLANWFAALDGGIGILRDTLGPVWRHTAVMVVTEFGRTAAVNGTAGTDHGTAGAGFLLGGAVAGGRAVADWPGLASSALYEGRDLRPTLDMRTVFKGVLHDHLRVARAALDSRVFPDSSEVAPHRDLIAPV